MKSAVKSRPLSIRAHNPKVIGSSPVPATTDKDVDMQGYAVTPAISDLLDKILNENPVVSTDSVTFLSVAKRYLADKHLNESFNEYRSQTSRINTIEKYLNANGKINLPFRQLDEQFLSNFTRFLKGGRSPKGKKLSERSIVNYHLLIRTLWNCAIREGVSNKNYPFGKQKQQVIFPETVKIGLTSPEMKRMEDLQLKASSWIFHDRNILLFCFAFGGMRISDAILASWPNFVDDRYYYVMGKNKKPGSIKIPNRAAKLLAYYKNDNDASGLIFPHLKCFKNDDPELISKRINNIVSRINQNCKQIAKLAFISKQIGPHKMRHTFGNLAGNKVAVQTLQKIYRHAEIKTTIGYQQNFIHEDADAAIDRVVDLEFQ